MTNKAIDNKINKIGNYLNKREIEYSISYSNLSNSVYFSIESESGEYKKIRISDHELPVSYNNDSDYEVRYSDALTEIYSVIKSITGTKKIITKKYEELTDEEYEMIEKSIKRINKEAICRIYNIIEKDGKLYKTA